jgi:hypothetical protein
MKLSARRSSRTWRPRSRAATARTPRGKSTARSGRWQRYAFERAVGLLNRRHLRSLTAFVGNACFKNTLNLVIWWPYYVLRPFTGFILGIVVVVIVQGGFLAVGSTAPNGTLWWVAVPILAGFGDDEFTQKLRQLTKTLFGTTSPKSEGNEKNPPPPPASTSTSTPPAAPTSTPPAAPVSGSTPGSGDATL